MNRLNDTNTNNRKDAMLRVEGILELWEPIDALEYVSPFDRRCSRMVWRPYFCVLLPQERTLVHYSIRHPAGQQQAAAAAASSAHQSPDGLNTSASLMGTAGSSRPALPSSALNKIDEAKTPSALADSVENLQDSGVGISGSHDRSPDSPKQFSLTTMQQSPGSRRRRVSVPTRTDGCKSDAVPAPSDTAKKSSFLSFFQSKSKKTSEKVDGRPVSCGQLKAWFSHDSLLSSTQQQSTVVNKLSLPTGQTTIRDLHLSVLQRDHCFEVTTPEGGSRCYCASNADSHREWMSNLSLTIDADLAAKNRVENSLTLSVAEAKNVASKKKCFCEVYINDSPAAKTTAKQNDNILFWGEQFELKSLPAVKTVTIKLYEQPDSKKKKEGKQLLGSVEIPAADMSTSNPVEKWYTLNSPSANRKSGGSEAVVLRVKTRYQSVPILPVAMYEELVDFLEVQYKQLVESLEPVLSTKVKEDVSDSLVRVMIGLGHDVDFLTDITMAEVSKIENVHLTFRGNSLATKAVEAYLKITAQRYVKLTLEDVIHSLIDNSGDCEVDPGRLTGKTSLTDNQARLCEACQTAWYKIFNSTRAFPAKLKVLFSRLRHCCTQMQYTDVSNHLISACVFLRLICPAILSPNLFRLTQDFPTAKAARTLTLVAKTVQTLANFSEFGHKEDYMTFMNSFIETESANMKTFLHLISDGHSQSGSKDTSLDTPPIDIGLELSVLHAKLNDVLSKIVDNKTATSGDPVATTSNNAVFETLRRILANIDGYAKNPELFHCKAPPTALQPPPAAPQRARVGSDSTALTMTNDQVLMSRARRRSRPESWNMSVLMNDVVLASSAAAVPRTGDGLGSIPGQQQQHRQQVPPQMLDETKVEESWKQMVSVADSASSGGYVTLVPFNDQDRARKSSVSRPPLPPKDYGRMAQSSNHSQAASDGSFNQNGSDANMMKRQPPPQLSLVNGGASEPPADDRWRNRSTEQLNADGGLPSPRSPTYTRTMPAVPARRLSPSTVAPVAPRKLSASSVPAEAVSNGAGDSTSRLLQASPPTDGFMSVSQPRPLNSEQLSNGRTDYPPPSANDVKMPLPDHSIGLLQIHDELAKKSAALRVAERRDQWPGVTLASTDNEAEFV